MNDFSGLSNQLTILQDMRKSVKFQLRHPLDGRLLISCNAGGPAFFRESYAEGKRILKGIGRKPQTIYRLAHQRYLEELMETLDYNIAVLSKAENSLAPMDFADILKKLPKNYDMLKPELILEPSLLDGREKRLHPVRDGSIKPAQLTTRMDGVMPFEWMYQRYCENTFHLENKNHVSASGYFTRSKSEASILGLYEEKQIAFHYDELLRVPRGYISPDFYWIARFGKVIAHEHAGGMSDPIYAEHHYSKMEVYRANGFEQGKNLLVTFDDENGNINLSLISAMIDDMLQR